MTSLLGCLTEAGMTDWRGHEHASAERGLWCKRGKRARSRGLGGKIDLVYKSLRA
jgi:hypothetical protein